MGLERNGLYHQRTITKDEAICRWRALVLGLPACVRRHRYNEAQSSTVYWSPVSQHALFETLLAVNGDSTQHMRLIVVFSEGPSMNIGRVRARLHGWKSRCEGRCSSDSAVTRALSIYITNNLH